MLALYFNTQDQPDIVDIVTGMGKSLFIKEVVPFLAVFSMLIVVTLIIDFLLHQFKMIWIGRYLGIPGTILILLSFPYSLRKRKLVRYGNPKVFLKLHELLAWIGSLMILIHAGVHFYAILPWLATIAMLINVISGLTGKYLLDRSLRQLIHKKEAFQHGGMSEAAVEKEIFWDAVTLDLMKKWRTIHLPITLVFSILAFVHIIGIALFWQWK